MCIHTYVPRRTQSIFSFITSSQSTLFTLFAIFLLPWNQYFVIWVLYVCVYSFYSRKIYRKKATWSCSLFFWIWSTNVLLLFSLFRLRTFNFFLSDIHNLHYEMIFGSSLTWYLLVRFLWCIIFLLASKMRASIQ